MMVKSEVTLIIASGRGTGGLSTSPLAGSGDINIDREFMFRGYNL